MQNTDTLKFKKDYEAVWRAGLFKDQSEFCEKLGGYNRTTVNLVLKGKRNAPMPLLTKFYKHFEGFDFRGNEMKINETPVASDRDYSDRELIKTAIEGLRESVAVLKGNNEYLQNELHDANQLIRAYIKKAHKNEFINIGKNPKS